MSTTNHPLVLEYRGDVELHRAGDLVNPGINAEVARFLNETGRLANVTLSTPLEREDKPLTLPTPDGYHFVHIPGYEGAPTRIGTLQENLASSGVSERQISIANQIMRAIMAAMKTDEVKSRWARSIPFEVPLPLQDLDFRGSRPSLKTLFPDTDRPLTRPEIWTDHRALWPLTVCAAITIGLGRVLNETPVDGDRAVGSNMVTVNARRESIHIYPKDQFSHEIQAGLRNLRAHPEMLEGLDRY